MCLRLNETIIKNAKLIKLNLLGLQNVSQMKLRKDKEHDGIFAVERSVKTFGASLAVGNVQEMMPILGHYKS